MKITLVRSSSPSVYRLPTRIYFGVLVASIAVLLNAPQIAFSQTFTFTPTTSTSGVYNWSTGGNWSTGTAPTAGGSATTILDFGNGGSTSFTANNDDGTGATPTFTLNGLIFGDNGGQMITLAGQNLTVTGSSGTPAITLSGANSLVTINNNVTFSISSTIIDTSTTTASLTFAGPVTLGASILVATGSANTNVTFGGNLLVAITSGNRTITNSGTGLVTIGTSGGNNLITSNGGGLTLSGSGNFLVNSAFDSSVSGLTISLTGGATATLASGYGGTGTVAIGGTGGMNLYSYGVLSPNGTTALTWGSSAIYNSVTTTSQEFKSANLVSGSNGSVFAQGNITFDALGVTANPSGTRTLTLGSLLPGATVTYTANGPISTLSLDIINNATFYAGAATAIYTPLVTLTGSPPTQNGTGSIIMLGSGGTFIFDNTTNDVARLVSVSGALATGTVTLNLQAGGTFRFLANPSVTAVNNTLPFGAITLGAGVSAIDFGASGNAATISGTSLTRASGGILFVSGLNVGSGTSGPTLSFAGLTPGFLNGAVLFNQGGSIDFATYDATLGVSTMSYTQIANGGAITGGSVYALTTSGQTASAVGPASLAGLKLNASTVVDGGSGLLSFSGTANLNNNAGGIIATGGASQINVPIQWSSTGELDVYLDSSSSLALGSSATLSGGTLGIDGPGTFTFSAVGNTLSAIVLTQGALNLSIANEISSSVMLSGAGTYDLSAAGALTGSAATFSGTNVVLSTTGAITSNTLTITGSNVAVSASNPFATSSTITLTGSTLTIANGLSVNVGALTNTGAISGIWLGTGSSFATNSLTGSFGGGYSVTLSANSTFTDGNSGTNTRTSTISVTALSSSATFIKNGTGGTSLSGVVNMNGGAFDLFAGTVSLTSGLGQINNANIYASPGTILTATNSTALTSYANDAVYLAGSTFALTNTSAVANTISLGGPITLQLGQSTINLTQSGTAAVTLSASQLSRANHASLLLGGGIASIGGTTVPFDMLFTTAPTLAGNGGVFATSATVSNGIQAILPYALASLSSTTAAFVTYDSTNGLRPATLTGETLSVTNSLATASPSSNVVLTLATSSSFTTASTTVNALLLNDTGTSASASSFTGTLDITSGLIAYEGTNLILSGGASTGKMILGDGVTYTGTVNGVANTSYNEAIFYAVSSSYLLLGSGGVAPTFGDNSGTPLVLVKTGNSSAQLFLYGTNTYSGGTVINAGIIDLRGALALGSGGVTFSSPTSTLRFDASQLGSGTGNVALPYVSSVPTDATNLPSTYVAGIITTSVSSNQFTNYTTILTLGGLKELSTTYSGQITQATAANNGWISPLGLNVKFTSPSTTLTLTGTSNNFTGGLTLSSGVLAAPSQVSIGGSANTITFAGGQLTIFQGLDSSGNTLSFSAPQPVVVAAAGGTISMTSGATAAAFNGPITGSGSLTLNGSGTWTLGNSANTNTGSYVVNGGTLYISGDTSLGAVPATTKSTEITLNGGTLRTAAGGLTGVALTSAGTGYTSLPTATLSGANGTDVTATVTAGIGAINVLTGGGGATNYTSTPNVTISGGGGTGATAHAVTTAGVVTSIVVDNPGSGYTFLPVVGISGGGSPTATATATVSAISLSGLLGTGLNFAGTPTVAITGGGGSGATGTATTLSGSVVTLNSNRGIVLAASGGTLEQIAGSVLSYGGVITGSGALTVTGNGGGGAVYLAGLNTYTGSTTITGSGTVMTLAGALHEHHSRRVQRRIAYRDHGWRARFRHAVDAHRIGDAGE